MPSATHPAPTARTSAPVDRIPGFVAEKPGRYRAKRLLTEQQIIKAAAAIIDRQAVSGELPITNEHYAGTLFQSRLGGLEHEVFAVAFLDSKHRLIKFEVLFRGTIDSTSVYPREVVKACMTYNAAAVIVAHNHPSGDTSPSQADRTITDILRRALTLVEVRLLDHFIIGQERPFSFAQFGLL